MKKLVKIACGLVLLTLVMLGSIWIQGLPARIDRVAAESKPPPPGPPDPIFIADMTTLRAQPAPNDEVAIALAVEVQNPRDTPIFVGKGRNLGKFWILGTEVCKTFYHLRFDALSEATIPPKHVRVFECYFNVPATCYRNITGRKNSTSIDFFWQESGKNGFDLHSTDAEGNKNAMTEFPRLN